MNQRLRLTAVILSLALLVPGLAQAKTPKTGKSKSSHAAKSKRSAKSRKPRGQAAMNSERVREIQAALIREKYMSGEPNGLWDTRSRTAMQKFQADQGWQSKVVPDSRALIKLGLGPDHAGLLNPQTAAVDTIPGGGATRASTNLPAPEK